MEQNNTTPYRAADEDGARPKLLVHEEKGGLDAVEYEVQNKRQRSCFCHCTVQSLGTAGPMNFHSLGGLTSLLERGIPEAVQSSCWHALYYG